MLTSLTIEGFRRIAYANIDLTGAAIHAFYGLNEQGKSAIAEAIRFVYRGLSPRVSRKQDFDLLITRGKRSGAVELVAGDTPIRRNIKDGKLTTRASMNFEDLHVDLQLGAEEFGRYDEDKLRPLLLQLFNAKVDGDAVKERLLAKGVTPAIVEDALPLIRKVGFAVAHERAKGKKQEATGAWRALTGESYGHVKAEAWRPAILDQPVPTEEQVTKMQAEVKRLEGMRDSYQAALTAAKTTLELTGMVSDGTTLDDAEAALAVAEDNLKQVDEQILAARQRYEKSIADDEDRLRAAEHALVEAKNAAAQLCCPGCKIALQVVMVDQVPVLERAIDDTRKSAANVAVAANQVNAAKQALQARKQGRDTVLFGLNTTRGQAQDAVHLERNTVDNVRKLANMPKVTKEELVTLQEELSLLSEPLEKAKAMLVDLELKRKHHAQALTKETEAKEQHQLAQQWALVEEACGPTASGIPAELVTRITRPINLALTKIASMWDADAVMITPDMQLQRTDGEPYMLMSESAQWRANAMVQLALAQLTELKVVCIDRFDVALARAAFFDMLSQYTQLNPEVTVIACGSLKNTPPPFEGVKFHHVDNGGVTTIEHTATEASDAS
jgi:hypothetical protein